MHIEDLKRPVGAWLLVCRLLRDGGEASTWGLMRAMNKASRGLYGQTYPAVLRCCRSLEEQGIIAHRKGAARRRLPAPLLWSLTSDGADWFAEEMARLCSLLAVVETKSRKP